MNKFFKNFSKYLLIASLGFASTQASASMDQSRRLVSDENQPLQGGNISPSQQEESHPSFDGNNNFSNLDQDDENFTSQKDVYTAQKMIGVGIVFILLLQSAIIYLCSKISKNQKSDDTHLSKE